MLRTLSKAIAVALKLPLFLHKTPDASPTLAPLPTSNNPSISLLFFNFFHHSSDHNSSQDLAFDSTLQQLQSQVLFMSSHQPPAGTVITAQPVNMSTNTIQTSLFFQKLDINLRMRVCHHLLGGHVILPRPEEPARPSEPAWRELGRLMEKAKNSSRRHSRLYF